MAQFSIRQAVKFAFTAYAKHWMVLLAAGIIVAFAGVVGKIGPRFVGQRMGMDLPIHECSRDAQPMILETLTIQPQHILNLNVPNNNSLLHLLGMLVGRLFFWCLFLLASCGLIRIVLKVKDKNTASLRMFFEDRRVILVALGVAAILGFYGWCMLVGVGSLAIPVVSLLNGLLRLNLSDAVAQALVQATVFLGFGFWFVGYIFAFFCVVDKPKTEVRESLMMSQTLVSGSRFKLMGAFILLACILVPLGFLIKNILMMVGLPRMCLSKHAVVTALLLPIVYLYLGYLYRGLHR